MRRIVIFICGIVLLWAAALWLDITPVLRGGFGWRWSHDQADPERWFVFCIGLMIYVGGALWMLRQKQHHLLLWYAGGAGIVLTLGAVYVREADIGYELYTRTLGGQATGWHYASTDIEDLDATLRNWPDFMDSYVGQSSHMTTSPPGLPLLFYGTTQAFAQNPLLVDKIGPPLQAAQCHNDRVVGWSLHPGYTNAELSSTLLGVLMPFWSALTVLPLHVLGKRLYSEEIAAWSVAWWPLVPSFLMFSPNPTPLYAAIALTVVFWTSIALETRKAIPLLGAGLLIGLGTFLHFTVLPIVFLCGLLTLAYHWQHRAELDSRWSIRAGMWYGAGLSLTWVIYWMISGVTVFDILQQTFDEHLALDRPYLPWLWLHVNDFFMFTGWPFVLLAGIGLLQIVRQWVKTKQLSLGKWVLLGTCVTLLLMDLTGTTQGESGRIWLFLSPFVLVGTASALASHPGHFWNGALVTGTQALALAVMVGTLPVVNSGLTEPPTMPPEVRPPPSPLIPVEASFADTLNLTAFSGTVEGNTIQLWLDWEANGRLETPYYIALLAVDQNGEPAEEAVVVQPFEENNYPITCWDSESGMIRTYFEVPLKNEATPGAWWVSLSLVDREGRAVSVRTGANERDFQVGIGPITR